MSQCSSAIQVNCLATTNHAVSRDVIIYGPEYIRPTTPRQQVNQTTKAWAGAAVTISDDVPSQTTCPDLDASEDSSARRHMHAVKHNRKHPSWSHRETYPQSTGGSIVGCILRDYVQSD